MGFRLVNASYVILLLLAAPSTGDTEELYPGELQALETYKGCLAKEQSILDSMSAPGCELACVQARTQTWRQQSSVCKAIYDTHTRKAYSTPNSPGNRTVSANPLNPTPTSKREGAGLGNSGNSSKAAGANPSGSQGYIDVPDAKSCMQGWNPEWRDQYWRARYTNSCPNKIAVHAQAGTQDRGVSFCEQGADCTITRYAPNREGLRSCVDYTDSKLNERLGKCG
jgi:hypothetical protein